MFGNGLVFTGPLTDDDDRAMTLRKIAPWVLVLITVVAYQNCWRGVFVYDDRLAIEKNPTIRQLWPPWGALTPPTATPVAARPVVNFTLAVNYAISGLKPWSYHLFNLLVHLLSGLLLFGILRRALRDDGLASIAAGLWLVHPLQTESVMYVTQRTELLWSFFFLLALYCVIRSAGSPRPSVWHAGAVVSCALGMGSKEVMVVAPLLILLYDRIFLSDSWRATFRQRGGLYAGLAATWLIVAVWQLGRPRADSVGFDFAQVTAGQYALTQCGVIAHYLRLTFWPRPLVLDYDDWPVAHSLTAVWRQALLILVLLVATGWACWRRPRAGYLGAWFFLILAPTSSVVPIVTEIAAERRMYLPLAAVIVAVVWAGRQLKVWRGLLVMVAGGFLVLTMQRNRRYESEITILQSVVVSRPGNARAQTNLGNAYLRQGDLPHAAAHYATAVQLRPRWAEARNNLGVALAGLGRTNEAIAAYRQAAQLDPQLLDAQFNLGVTLVGQGKYAEAIPHLEAALKLKSDLPAARAALRHALTHAATP